MSTRVIYEDALCQIVETWTDDLPPVYVRQDVIDKPGSPNANAAAIRTKVNLALVANVNDAANDATIIAQAATISGSSGTLTAAQLSGAVRQLAQAVSALAGADTNTKKELQALVRLAVDALDSTDGT